MLRIKNSSTSDKHAKIEDVQISGYEIVTIVEGIFKELGLPFFADYGTLLGFIREKGFIKWDDDLDYGFVLSNSHVWMDIEEKMTSNGFTKVREFTLDGRITEQCYQYGIATIDLFSRIIDNTGTTIEYAYFRDPNIQYHDPDKVSVLRGEYVDLSQTMIITLENGIEVHVPKEYDVYLTQIYGNWRVPDPNYKDGSGSTVKVLNGVYGHCEHF